MLKHKDLESWEIFCAVAEAGSISGACDLCDCDAAYISRLIKNLENSIGGVELLDRTTLPFNTDGARQDRSAVRAPIIGDS